jgi:hypothetical protein
VVLDEAVYDVLFGTTAISTLAAGALMGLADGAITAVKIADAAIDFATFAADCKTGTGLKANVESISNGAITASAIATGAITSAKFAAGAIDAAAIANNAIDAATFAADVDAEIATMVWNAATASYGGAGTYGQAVEDIIEDTGTTLPATLSTIAGYIDTEVAAILAAVDTEIAAILADTNELQTDWVNGGRLDLLIDAIKAKTDSLTFTVAGNVDCNVQSWGGAAAPAMTGDAYARLGAPAGASVSADIAAVKAETAGILADTGTDGVVVASHTVAAKAEIKAEVVAAIGTDTIAEMAQGAPPATPTFKQALMYLFMAWRNQSLRTSNLWSVTNDAGTVICKATLSDDGTTFTKAEFVTGP